MPDGYGFLRRGLMSSIEPNKKAEGLLLSVLDKTQRKAYKKYKSFSLYEQKKDRVWEFYFRYHYPVEVITKQETFQLCVDFAEHIPTEDLLLAAYLEVKGGRGDKLFLLRNSIGFNYAAAHALCAAMRASAVSMRELAYGVRQVCRAMSRLDPALPGGDYQGTYTETNERAVPLTLQELEATVSRLRRECGPPVPRRVSCSLRGNQMLHRHVTMLAGADAPPLEHIATVFGMEVYVDPNQKEPFRLLRR